MIYMYINKLAQACALWRLLGQVVFAKVEKCFKKIYSCLLSVVFLLFM